MCWQFELLHLSTKQAIAQDGAGSEYFHGDHAFGHYRPESNPFANFHSAGDSTMQCRTDTEATPWRVRWNL
jgi:hypothetical protein